MTNPWMIMAVGVLAVFVVLFLIIFLLRRRHGHPAPLPEMVEVPQKPVPAVSPGATLEDESLIAVLTAAVAAARGSKPGSFAITQVHQSASEIDGGFNTPIWGRVERLARK